MKNVRRDLVAWWLVNIVVSYVIFTKSAVNQFISPTNINCVCSGSVLTYTCTIVGGGNTQWGGSDFKCSITSDQIILRHSQYATPGGTFGSCTNGAINGRSIRVEGSCYTSQINITLNTDFSNISTVSCSYISNDGVILIGQSSLNLISAPYPPPSDIILANASSDSITFRWTSVNSDCSSVNYIITSTADCGDCPSTTNATMVTCYNITVPSMCTLSSQSVICSFTGTPSNEIVVPIKFPDVPRVGAIIPHYSNSTQFLIKLTFNINQTTVIATHDPLRPTRYKVSYENSSQIPDIIRSSNCISEDCEYVVIVSSSLCSSSAYINTTVSAINVLGEGDPTEGISRDCRADSNFVKVEYISRGNTVLCTFQNTLDSSQKSCSVRYGECNNTLSLSVDTMTTSGESSNVVSLELNPNFVGRPFCYAITAGNATYTIIVEGKIDGSDVDGTHNNNVMIIIIATVVPICVLLLLLASIAVIVVLVAVSIARKSSNGNGQASTRGEEHAPSKISQKIKAEQADQQIKKSDLELK